LSCAGPHITIDKDTVYESHVPEFPDEYYLGPGDVIEIIYHVIPTPTGKEYVLSVGDVIRVEFFYHPNISREVSILPDGKICLPLKGEIAAAGLTPLGLTKKLTEIYSDNFKDPSITVTLVEYDQPINQLRLSIANRDRGQSKLSIISPDGYITLPLLPQPIKASGLTLTQLKEDVSNAYNKILNNLSLSLILEKASSNLVYVLGEVRKPDYYQMDTPTTLTQVLSRAGGLLDTAKTSTILVLSRDKQKRPVGRLVDLDKIIGEGNIGNDQLLRQYDVVYVPKSTIANVDLFIDQYVNRIIPNFFRTSLVFGYDVFRITP